MIAAAIRPAGAAIRGRFMALFTGDDTDDSDQRLERLCADIPVLPGILRAAWRGAARIAILVIGLPSVPADRLGVLARMMHVDRRTASWGGAK